MSNNKELTPLERDGLLAAGLPVDTPSQLSDAFRLGIAHLQKQNDELRAKVAKYESVLCQTCQGAGTVLAGIDDGRDCPTCAKSLSDVKADAVIGAIEKCNANAEEEDNGERLIYVSDLVDYANQLKEGGV